MSSDLGIQPGRLWKGVGLLLHRLCACAIPLQSHACPRFGSRCRLARIMLTWGIISIGYSCLIRTHGARSTTMQFLLGTAREPVSFPASFSISLSGFLPEHRARPPAAPISRPSCSVRLLPACSCFEASSRTPAVLTLPWWQCSSSSKAFHLLFCSIVFLRRLPIFFGCAWPAASGVHMVWFRSWRPLSRGRTISAASWRLTTLTDLRVHLIGAISLLHAHRPYAWSFCAERS